MSRDADPDSPTTNEVVPASAPADVCDVCARDIGWTGIVVMAWHASNALDSWGFCQDCWNLLRETIRVEVEHGPGTPPPGAWTKVRKLRAARERRWGKADP